MVFIITTNISSIGKQTVDFEFKVKLIIYTLYFG